MDSLNLSVPLQHDYRDPTVERDVARLQHWLSNLPLMDVMETVRLVHAGLDALNEQKLDHAQRFRFLEIYRTTIQRLFATLDPLHLRQLSLSKTQRLETIKGLAELLLSMAGGYKLIVMLLYQSRVPGRPVPELLGLAINRALEQLGYAVLDSYRFYRALQPFVFAELHQLYRLARYHGLLDSHIEVADDASETALTTAMLYHASMLLSLADPFRLAEGEVGFLFDVLQRHAGECRIIPGNQWPDNGAGLFLIDLQGDAPPVACAGQASPAPAREPYLLDARQALASMRESLAGIPAQVRTLSPEAMLLRCLQPEDHDAAGRRAPRRAAHRSAQLLLGLESIHHYLLAVAASARQQVVDSGTSRGEGVSCRVVDASEGGMKLAWETGGAGDARIGDLLAVLESEAGRAALRLAIIRSMLIQPEGGIEIGVEVMEGGLGPVSCATHDGPDQAVHALFMPANEAQGSGATLIAAKGFYETGQRLFIDVGGKHVSARAGRRVVDSPVFDRFEFSAE